MKITIYFAILLLTFSSITFGQSIINYQSGTTIDVQTVASVCADSIIINGTFTGGGTICGFLYTLNITTIVEGFYSVFTDSMVSDSLRVYLRDATFPYSIVDSSIAVLNTSGAGAFYFSNVMNGTSYYIIIKHRNSLEVWSNTTQLFTGGTFTYDFTSAATQAYGDNMVKVNPSPLRFAMYGGDVYQDGIIDGSDLSQVDNDAGIGLSGYVQSDLTGDDYVDASDISVVDYNSGQGVYVVIP